MRTASGCCLAEINVMLLVPGCMCLFPKVCILRSDGTFNIGQTKRVIPCSHSVLLYIIYLRACVCL